MNSEFTMPSNEWADVPSQNKETLTKKELSRVMGLMAISQNQTSLSKFAGSEKMSATIPSGITDNLAVIEIAEPLHDKIGLSAENQHQKQLDFDKNVKAIEVQPEVIMDAALYSHDELMDMIKREQENLLDVVFSLAVCRAEFKIQALETKVLRTYAKELLGASRS